MKPATLLLGLALTASAHRLDEYLQAATIAVGQGSVTLELHLTPGIAIFPILIATIDSNSDDILSPSEASAYARAVQSNLSLTIDGHPVSLDLTNQVFPTVNELREGRGSITLSFQAVLPPCSTQRSLRFENHHQRPISVYLANALVPTVPNVKLVHQRRNYEQSTYELGFTTPAPSAAALEQAALALLLIVFLTRLIWLHANRVAVPTHSRHGAILPARSPPTRKSTPASAGTGSQTPIPQ